MKKYLLYSGIGAAGIGVVVALIAGISYFNGLEEDSTGAGKMYDQQVEQYNEQVEQYNEDNPNAAQALPAKTRLEIHNENIIFGLVMAIALILVGCVLYYANRSEKPTRYKHKP